MNKIIAALIFAFVISEANAQDYPYTITMMNGTVSKDVKLFIVSDNLVKVEAADTTYNVPAEDILKINYYSEGGVLWGLKKGSWYGAWIGGIAGGVFGLVAKQKSDENIKALQFIGYAMLGMIELGIIGGIFGIIYGVSREADEEYDLSGMTPLVKKQTVFNVINKVVR